MSTPTMRCNRADSTKGVHMGGCQRKNPEDPESDCRNHFDSEWVWKAYPGNNIEGCGTNSKTSNCMKRVPRSQTKLLDCCFKAASQTTTETCGDNGCPGTPECDARIDAFCLDPQNILDTRCDSRVSDAIKSTYCSEQANFNKPGCQSFCTNQFTNSSGTYFGNCLSTAKTFCNTNDTDPRCACLNASQTKAYKDYMGSVEERTKSKFGDTQCFWPTCNKGDTWNTTFRSRNDNNSVLNCPQCVQTLLLDNVTDINKIAQSCSSENSNGPSSLNSTNTNTNTNSSETISSIMSLISPGSDPASAQNSWLVLFFICICCVLPIFGVIIIAASQ
jgi:hypothetical protein